MKRDARIERLIQSPTMSWLASIGANVALHLDCILRGIPALSELRDELQFLSEMMEAAPKRLRGQTWATNELRMFWMVLRDTGEKYEPKIAQDVATILEEKIVPRFKRALRDPGDLDNLAWVTEFCLRLSREAADYREPIKRILTT
ncbi:MAG TPA: hypothetical protein VM103_02615 [Candidatus Paceibacterota bacterium]|nr:hypothetical protein [Candidatus Paceibacterota bacterium]